MAGELPKPRVMVDANILIAGNVWPRWPYEVLQHALRGDYQLVLIPYVIDEARRTLTNRFPLHVGRFEQVIAACDFETATTPQIEDVQAHQNLVRDIKDVPVALSAIRANVLCLVSEDKDLTADDETTAELRRHLTVYLSGTFLREVMDWTSEQLEQVRGRNWHDLVEQNGTNW